MEFSMKNQNALDITTAVFLSVDRKTENGAFPTKVSRQRAIDSINRGYDKLVKIIQNQICSIPLNIRHPEKETVASKAIKEMYWCMPHYPHQWRKSHSDLLNSSFSNEVEAIEYVVGLKEEVKNTNVQGGK